MKVYISGPISSLPIEEARANFAKVAEMLLKDSAIEDVVNPFDVGACKSEDCSDNPPFPDGTYHHSWECYLRYDLIALLDCDAIAMIPGWTNSQGAILEHHTAYELKFDIYWIDRDLKGATRG